MLQRVSLPLGRLVEDSHIETGIRQIAALFSNESGFYAGYYGRQVENLDILELFMCTAFLLLLHALLFPAPNIMIYSDLPRWSIPANCADPVQSGNLSPPIPPSRPLPHPRK